MLAGSAVDTVFLTWEWCHAWARAYVPDGALRVIVVLGDDGRPRGIAPLFLGPFEGPLGPLLRELRFLGTGEVCSCYLDLIVAEADRGPVTERVRDAIFSSLGAWDVLTLDGVWEGSPLVGAWTRILEASGRPVAEASEWTCPVIELPPTMEAFRAGLSRNARYNLKRKQRWLEAEGEVSFHHGGLGPEDPLGLATVEALHQRRWRAKDGPGAFASAPFRAFHKEVASVFAGLGWLDIDFLLLDGEPIAGIYGFTYGGCYYYYLTSFHPDRVPQASPGMQLLVHIVERAIERGCHRVDLLRGEAGYKSTLANGGRGCVGVRTHQGGPRVALYRSARATWRLARRLVR